jgi:hypothetical protein
MNRTAWLTMNRTAWLQDRRMQKFRDVLSRWERRELSGLEAGEILGVSERQFRRYRERYEEDGLSGLVDRRLGKASAKRVPVDKIAWMLGQYRTHHIGWDAAAYGGAGGARGAAWGAPSQTAAQAVRRHDAASGWEPLCVA